MAELVAQRITDTGLAPAYGAAASTFQVKADSVVLHVKNASGGSVNLTEVTPGTVDNDLAVGDRVVAIAAGQDRFVGPFPARAFKDSSDGLVHLALSATASVTVAALTL